MRSSARFLAALLSVGLLVCLLSSAIYLLGTDAPLMQSLMLRTAPPDAALLPEAEYPTAVRAITDYLTGAADEFQFTFTQGCTEYLGFNAREQAHMADCRTLFTLCRWLAAGSFVLCAVLLGLLIHHRRKADFALLAKLLRWETAVLTLLGVIAAFGFTDAFVLFHHLMFRNDLWLLNPQTDLLIRLMPTAFFERYALLIAGCFLGGTALAEGLFLWAAHRLEK